MHSAYLSTVLSTPRTTLNQLASLNSKKWITICVLCALSVTTASTSFAVAETSHIVEELFGIKVRSSRGENVLAFEKIGILPLDDRLAIRLAEDLAERIDQTYGDTAICDAYAEPPQNSVKADGLLLCYSGAGVLEKLILVHSKIPFQKIVEIYINLPKHRVHKRYFSSAYVAIQDSSNRNFNLTLRWSIIPFLKAYSFAIYRLQD